jgi:hypothetical protein
MFRLSCFVDDNRLALVMRLLTGQVRELQAQPVAEANLQGKTLVGQGGTMVERFVSEWRRRKLGKISAGEARELAKAIGLSPTSYGHILHNSIKGGYVVKAGKTGDGPGLLYALKEKAK